MGVCTSCGANVADDEMQDDTCMDCAVMAGDMAAKGVDEENNKEDEE